MPLPQQRRSLKNIYVEDDSSTSISDFSASSDMDMMDMNHMSAPDLYFRDSSYEKSILHPPTKRRSSVGPRNIFGKVIGDAIVSPVKAAKEQLQRTPPVSRMALLENMKKSVKKSSKSARKVLLKKESSPEASWRDDAFAVLLCRELETIDL